MWQGGTVWGARVIYCGKIKACIVQVDLNHMHAVRKRARYSENCAGLVVRHCLLLPPIAR